MEKTVLVTAANSLSAASCGQSISFDLGLGKAKSAANTKLISKSLWTCCVEAIVEYCRVVFDLFPRSIPGLCACVQLWWTHQQWWAYLVLMVVCVLLSSFTSLHENKATGMGTLHQVASLYHINTVPPFPYKPLTTVRYHPYLYPP